MWASRELVTCCTKQSPSWEANRLRAIQKSPAMYETRRFIIAYTRGHHLSLPWAGSHQSILSSHFLNIHLYIISTSRPGFSKLVLSLRFPTRALYAPLRSHILATCPTTLILLELNTRITLSEEFISFSCSSCSSWACYNAKFCEQERTAFRCTETLTCAKFSRPSTRICELHMWDLYLQI
jgi:hypothetical protein